MRSTEKQIEKRHVALVKKKAAKKASDPTCDLGAVIELMNRARKELDVLPEEQEFNEKQLNVLDDVRHEAIRLSQTVDAIFDTIEGT